MSDDPITADEYASRLRALLGPGNLTMGLPRKRRDQWILLHAVAGGFREDEPLREKDATARIQDFLLGPGRQLRVDAVTLRRALIDEGFCTRDASGHDFRAAHAYQSRVRFDADCALPVLDRG